MTSTFFEKTGNTNIGLNLLGIFVYVEGKFLTILRLKETIPI